MIVAPVDPNPTYNTAAGTYYRLNFSLTLMSHAATASSGYFEIQHLHECNAATISYALSGTD